jgi:osmotically-inducible protein OsmY
MTDEQLKDDVRAELRWDAQVVDPSEIAVSVVGEVVTLRGTVGSLPQRRAAVRAARRVLGVARVEDQLEVCLLTADGREDAEIRGAALQALDWNVAVPATRIDVQVEYGRAKLTGDVDWQYEAAAAEHVVMNLFGVVAVFNEIAVASPVAEIAGLADGIEAALIRSAQTDADRIRVTARDGEVTLTGRVSSWEEHDGAVAAVHAAPGVRSVNDQLVIRAGS